MNQTIMFSLWILAVWFVSSAVSMPNRRREDFGPEIFFRSVSLDFPKLTFAESECNSTKGRKGVCVGYPDCEGDDAVREGSCSDSFGTCCVYLMKASDTPQIVKSIESDRSSIFSNADFPLPTLLAESSVEIQIEQEICQIRLDFESLDLPENTVFQASVGDFVVPPILSGNNSGQHMVLGVGDEDPRESWVTLSISGPPSMKTWNINLTQVPCHSSMSAPAGCTQYFLPPSGHIRSLNVYSDESSTYAVCLQSKDSKGHLLSLKSFASESACSSSVQVPAGVALSGQEIPARICASDNVQISYKVFGPLVLYMKTSPGTKGIEFRYDL